VDRAKRVVTLFRLFFGKKKLHSITYGDVASYRRMRMATPTVHNRQRNIATMNRELVVLRRMFNIALAQDWIVKNPFNCGEPLISPADERIHRKLNPSLCIYLGHVEPTFQLQHNHFLSFPI
jgi:hypothetical protein